MSCAVAVLPILVLMTHTPARAQSGVYGSFTSCTGSSTPVLVVYNGTAITSVGIGNQRWSCAYTWNGVPDSNIAFTGCTTSATATATGTGGSTVSPRQALSSAGRVAMYQVNAAFNGNTPLTAANIAVGSSFLTSGSFTAGTVVTGTSNVALPIVSFTMPAGQNLAQGDYQTTLTIPLTLKWNSSRNPSYNIPADCTSATEGSTPFTLTLPITIRANSSCDIRPADMAFGQVGINAGTNTTNVSNATASVAVTCAPGVTHSLSIADGNNASGTGVYRRRMANGSAFLSYGLFTSSSYTTEWTSVAGATAGNGGLQTAAYTIYGRVPAQSSTALTNGLYVDTAIMVLTY